MKKLKELDLDVLNINNKDYHFSALKAFVFTESTTYDTMELDLFAKKEFNALVNNNINEVKIENAIIKVLAKTCLLSVLKEKINIPLNSKSVLKRLEELKFNTLVINDKIYNFRHLKLFRFRLNTNYEDLDVNARREFNALIADNINEAEIKTVIENVPGWTVLLNIFKSVNVPDIFQEIKKFIINFVILLVV